MFSEGAAMTVKDIVRELQRLVNTGHGDEQLMVGRDNLSVRGYSMAWDGSKTLVFNVAGVVVLVAKTDTPRGSRQLPQPQEQVKAYEQPTCASCKNFICSGWCQEELFSDGTKPMPALDKDQ